MSQEVWKPAVGFEGSYEVSNHGRVRSVSREVNSQGKGRRIVPSIIRKPCYCRGYQILNLSHRGKVTSAKVHRLVAEAFIPNPRNLETVDHLNDDRSDNRASNLVWASMKDNLQRAIDKGWNAVARPRKSNKLTIEDVREIRRCQAQGEATSALAKFYGVDRTVIQNIRKNKIWRETNGTR